MNSVMSQAVPRPDFLWRSGIRVSREYRFPGPMPPVGSENYFLWDAQA